MSEEEIEELKYFKCLKAVVRTEARMENYVGRISPLEVKGTMYEEL